MPYVPIQKKIFKSYSTVNQVAEQYVGCDLIYFFKRYVSMYMYIWGRKWQPTTVFLPGKSHGQRSLVGYSPWGCRVGHDLVSEHVYYTIIGKELEGSICFPGKDVRV